MQTSYETSGYGSIPIGFGVKPALLVVDFQLAFTDPAYPLGGFAGIHSAVENTIPLLKVARACNIPVASCYTSYHSQRDMPLWKTAPVREQFFHGHPCTAIDPRILDNDYDFAFCKSSASIFFATPLTTFLIKNRVDTVIITGCTTSGCIRASVIDAFSHGYRTIVAEDCSGDAEIEPHQQSLRDIGRRYADIVKSDQIAAYFHSVRG